MPNTNPRKLDHLDRLFLYRRLHMTGRPDKLNDTQYLNILLAIRELNRKRKTSNAVSIRLFLRLNNHCPRYVHLYNALDFYTETGYIRHRDARHSNYYLTEEGKQELTKYNRQMAHLNMLHRKADKEKPLPASRSGLKRPKTFL